MSISDKLRWRRRVNEIRFVHQEAELVEEVIAQAGQDFHEYYLQFAAKHHLDIKQLNQEHRARIEKIYGPESVEALTQHELTGALAVYETFPALDQEENPYVMTQDEIEIHESFNKLFKRLAMKIHPDKLAPTLNAEERATQTRMFKEAIAALEKRQYFVLIDMAEKLKIAQPKNYRQQNRWMKKEINKIRVHIKKQKTTYNYGFSECETSAEQDRLVKRFIYELFGIKL